MSMRYKFNVLEALKDVNLTTYKLRQKKLLSESTIQKLRNNQPVSWENIETICKLLNMQPGQLLEYVPDSDANFFDF